MESFSKVEVHLKDGREFEGILLPQSTKDNLVLKLSDGYNIGIDKKNISKGPIEKSKIKAKKQSFDKIKSNQSLPKVLILHTGGTIASKVDYSTGGVTNLIEPGALLAQYPKLQTIANVQAKFVSNMSSDDFRFSHVNILSDAVTRNSGKYSGIVITTGTDNMSFMAAALHYALLGIKCPVVLTGSQRSSDRGSSDASLNLAGAVTYACHGKPGVFLAMHNDSNDQEIAIHHGPHVRKMHTSVRGAFRSINTTPVAIVTPYKKSPIVSIRDVPATSKSKGKYDEKLKVAIAYLHPNFFPEQLKVYESFDALILLGSGLGHAPINVIDDSTKIHKKIAVSIQKLATKIPVVAASHCINGRVNLQVYSAGRKLREMGVLGHQLSLPPETLLAKVAWILSTNQKVHEMINADMGDLLDSTEEDSWQIN